MPTETQQLHAIQEFVDSRGAQLGVEAEVGVLRGVKLLGLASRNGRTYREEALRYAAPLYEGAKVNIDHAPGGPLAPRGYRDRLGVVKNVELRPGEGLFGTLVFNPKHALAEQLVWDAQHAPENVGLSHNVLARTAWDQGREVVEAIDRVQSVDLVADPATTCGLFEHSAPPAEVAPQAEPPLSQSLWESLTLERLAHHRPDLLQALRSEAWRERCDLVPPSSRERPPLTGGIERPTASTAEFVAAIRRR